MAESVSRQATQYQQWIDQHRLAVDEMDHMFVEMLEFAAHIAMQLVEYPVEDNSATRPSVPSIATHVSLAKSRRGTGLNQCLRWMESLYMNRLHMLAMLLTRYAHTTDRSTSALHRRMRHVIHQRMVHVLTHEALMDFPCNAHFLSLLVQFYGGVESMEGVPASQHWLVPVYLQVHSPPSFLL